MLTPIKRFFLGVFFPVPDRSAESLRAVEPVDESTIDFPAVPVSKTGAPKRYRHTHEVNAIQFDGSVESCNAIFEATKGEVKPVHVGELGVDYRWSGEMVLSMPPVSRHVHRNQYVVINNKGEICVASPKVFEAMYQPVSAIA